MPDNQTPENQSQFKLKASRAIAIMQRFNYVGLAFVVAGLIFIRSRGWSMIWFILLGSAIMFVSLGWAMLYWDCPHCGKNLRAINSILRKAKFCPFCGRKL